MKWCLRRRSRRNTSPSGRFRRTTSTTQKRRFTFCGAGRSLPFCNPVIIRNWRSGHAARSAHRESLMAAEAIGLPQPYNRFHDRSDNDPRIEAMRTLHCEIDLAVAHADGWGSLDLEHGYHEVPYLPKNDRFRFTISDRVRLAVLRRLSELNHQRYEEEVAQGLHGNATSRTSTPKHRRTSADFPQPSLDFDAIPAN